MPVGEVEAPFQALRLTLDDSQTNWWAESDAQGSKAVWAPFEKQSLHTPCTARPLLCPWCLPLHPAAGLAMLLIYVLGLSYATTGTEC